MVKILVSAGVPLKESIPRNSHSTFLYRAILSDNDPDAKIVKLLIEHGAIVRSLVKTSFLAPILSPIEVAADLGKWHLVSLLLQDRKSHSDPRTLQCYGNIVLKALKKDKHEIVSELLAAGASVSNVEPDGSPFRGSTALHLGHLKYNVCGLILRLLQYGAI